MTDPGMTQAQQHAEHAAETLSEQLVPLSAVRDVYTMQIGETDPDVCVVVRLTPDAAILLARFLRAIR